jgi:hypothetical protein
LLLVTLLSVVAVIYSLRISPEKLLNVFVIEPG